MSIRLPDLGNHFFIEALNEGNFFNSQIENGDFEIYPGVYLLSVNSEKRWDVNFKFENITIGEFVAPKPIYNSVYLKHQPQTEFIEGKLADFHATVVGLNADDNVTLYVNSPFWKTFKMAKLSANEFHTQIPADLMLLGKLSYYMVVDNGKDFHSFPGNYIGKPYSWDNISQQKWNAAIVARDSELEIFNANDENDVLSYPLNADAKLKTGYTSGKKAKQLHWFMEAEKLNKSKIMGFQFYFANKMSGRFADLSAFKKVIISVKTSQIEGANARFALIDKDANSFAVDILIKKDLMKIEIPFTSLQANTQLLLPRPYPDFMPLWFKSAHKQNFLLDNIEKLEFTIAQDFKNSKLNQTYQFEIESIKFIK